MALFSHQGNGGDAKESFIGEDSNGVGSSRDRGLNDVYVCVGKDDLDVLKWALDHAVLPGGRVFLVHVFPPITHIPTPIGKLAKSQIGEEQLRLYLREENNRRRNLLQKYVTVDTMLIESNVAERAILDLIPVVNITSLVIGTKRPLSSRRLKRGKAQFVLKNAPDYCEVSIIHNGNKVVNVPIETETSTPPSPGQGAKGSDVSRQSEKGNFFECVCFSPKFT
ncbi:UspA [Dillenia turbinata]|uniref:UspA n=1 Tax=Dillenia turbinata TaxID=194707 RepID=A0AAN8UWX0_9MAGN